MASSNSSVKMDVDNPHTLKRSSSAPMINELNSSSSVMSSQAPAVVLREPTTSLPPRPRRFSTSCSPLSGPSSPKLTHRVNQLRREESVDVLGREAAHERELNSAVAMSISCEDLTLVPDAPKASCDSSAETNGKNGKSLHLTLTSTPSSADRSVCSTPSPTRTTPIPRQFLSYNKSLTPSPTRRFSRSQSPIQMRPAQFSVSNNPVKRKFDLEENEPPAKKFGSLILNNQRVEEAMVVSNESGTRRAATNAEQTD